MRIWVWFPDPHKRVELGEVQWHMLTTPAPGGGDTQLWRALLDGLPTQPLAQPVWTPGKQQTWSPNTVDSLWQTRLKVDLWPPHTHANLHQYTHTYVNTHIRVYTHTKRPNRNPIWLRKDGINFFLHVFIQEPGSFSILSPWDMFSRPHPYGTREEEGVTLSSVYSTLALDPGSSASYSPWPIPVSCFFRFRPRGLASELHQRPGMSFCWQYKFFTNIKDSFCVCHSTSPCVVI